MINLLSTDRKTEIRAARANVILSRYIAIIAVALVFILGVLYVSHMLLTQTMDSAETRIAANDTKAGVFSATKQEVEALSAKLNDAKLLLDQEVSYANILTTLGRAMPAGTRLDSLTLNDSAISSGTPVELTAYAENDEKAATIQQALQISGLFSLVTLTSTNTDNTAEGYPVKVALTVTFNKAGMR